MRLAAYRRRMRVAAGVIGAAVGATAAFGPAAEGRPLRGPSTAPSTAPAGRGDMRYSEADDGKTFTVTAGEKLDLRLIATPGTGYRWDRVEGPATAGAIEADGDPTIEPGGSRRLGGPKTAIYHFKAARPGAATLELVYQRPWEKQTPPARALRLHFLIQAAETQPSPGSNGASPAPPP